MRFGSSGVLFSLSGRPRLRVRGASTTLCLRVIFPLAMTRGWKSSDSAPFGAASRFKVRLGASMALYFL